MSKSLRDLTVEIIQFRDERGWDPYHTPSHLSRALSIEASELEEEFLWKGPEGVQEHLRSERGREAVRDEVGDVLIYTLLLCEEVGIDPLNAISKKLEKNRGRFPVEDATTPARSDGSSS